MDDLKTPTAPDWVNDTPPVSAYEADERIDLTSPPAPAAEKPAPVARPTPAAPTKPVSDPLAADPIFVVKGHIHQAVDAAMAILSNPSLGIYARGDDLVRAVTYSMPARTLTLAKQGENVDRPDGAIIIATLSDVALVETLSPADSRRHRLLRKKLRDQDDYQPAWRQ